MTDEDSVWFDMFAIWMNAGMSAVAAVTMLIASRHSFPEFRAVRAAGGVLASIYCGAYIWLAFHLERSREWSNLLRPVALLVWPIVWIIPTVLSMRLWSKLVRAVEGKVPGDVRGDDV